MNETDLFQQSMRDDFKFYVQVVFEILNPGQRFEDNWHIDLLCHAAMEILAGRKRRIAIVLPPRALKSVIFSIALPTFALGRDPTATFMFVSHNMQLTTELSSGRRKVMASKRYKDAFPNTRLSASKNTELHFETTAGGSCRATTPGKGVTGLGAKYLFVDDIVDAKDANNVRLHADRFAWLQRGFFTRTNLPNEAIQVIIGQRLHYYDTIGHFLATGDFEQIVIPAIENKDKVYEWGNFRHSRPAGDILLPALLGEEELARRRRAMTNADFQAQYLLDPIPEGGGLLKWSWFKHFDQLPEGMLRFLSCDMARTANGGDFTVIMTIGYWNEQYFIIDVYRQQLDYDSALGAMRIKIRSERPDGVIIDASDGAGHAAYRTLIREGVKNIHGFKSNIPKKDRLFVIVPILEGGDVFIPRDADFISALRVEFISFPENSEHDDQLDALSQCIQWSPALIRGAGGKAPRKYRPRVIIRVNGAEPSSTGLYSERAQSNVGTTDFDTRNRAYLARIRAYQNAEDEGVTR
jgi:predicted phage terminase large subunit-like protein